MIKKNNEYSDISSHKKNKKKLIPPLLQIDNLSPCSWINDRLPDSLWSVLVIGSLDRETALDFFRYVSNYVEKNKEFADITHTSLGDISEDKLSKFIQHLVSYSDDIKRVLQPSCYYPEIPGFKTWKECIGLPDPKDAIKILSDCIKKTSNHQSQEATDCRWVKVLCMILGDKLVIPSKFEEQYKGILYYPNYGDMRQVRPTIRSCEIMLQSINLIWPSYFWKYNYTTTACIPELKYSQKYESICRGLDNQIKNQREKYINQLNEVNNDLISHFFKIVDNTDLNIRKESIFGLSLYSLTLFREIITYSITHSIVGRIALRSLVDSYISLKYLLKKEKDEPEIWNDFYEYGKGQAKLIYLKIKEMEENVSFLDLDEIGLILNEDKWLEYIPINLGHWNSNNTRSMSEEAGIKEIYDKYFNYTSGYVHATGFAIRESVYQFCLNPLHRFHRIPIFGYKTKSNIVPDSIELLNKILGCLAKTYPTFDSRMELL